MKRGWSMSFLGETALLAWAAPTQVGCTGIAYLA